MRWQLYTSLAIIITLFACQRDQEVNPTYFSTKNDWQKDNIYSEVKSIKLYAATINQKTKIADPPVKTYVKTYSLFGKLLSIEKYSQHGQIEYRLKKLFSQDKKLLQTEEVNMLLFQKIKKDYSYTEKYNKITHYTNDTLTHVEYNKFDTDENLISTLKTNGIDSININYTYTYDSLHRKIEQKIITINPTGIKTSTTKTKYSAEGNLIELVNDRGYLGTLSWINAYEGKTLLSQTKYENGFIASEIHFDDHYNPILKKKFLSTKLVRQIKYKYKYDKRGNWINRNTYVNDQSLGDDNFILSLKELRKLEYYQ